MFEISDYAIERLQLGIRDMPDYLREEEELKLAADMDRITAGFDARSRAEE